MRPYDRNATVHALFAGQAESAPQDIAVASGDNHDLSASVWRYGELEQQARNLAQLLARAGVAPGDRVALLCGRSATTIVAMLAVLKCGAAFAPLDPAYPPARLAMMLEDVAPALLLRDAGLEPPPGWARGAGCAPPVLEIEAALAAASRLGPGAEPAPVAVTADAAAYVMFTSGSTGRPKGVVVPHRAIVRLVSDQSYVHIAPDDVVLHLAPLAFDASTFEIWGALLNGAQLAIVPEARPSLDGVLDSIARHQVTVAWFTAGLFHALVDHQVAALAPLRCLLAGGDVLSPAHVARLRAALPDCRFVNGYGPTENTTFSCCHVLDDTEDGAIPIGACINHATAWVADDNLRPVADGAPGQLVVGGDGLAIGYLNAPELTAQKFVTVPATGERVYLTGDIVVRRPDGVFTFHGRADRQIKIDGKRVELGEIEAALRDCDGVADAAVLCAAPQGAVSGAASGAPPRLLAWIVGRQPRSAAGDQAFAEAVRRAVAAELPAHMQPARVSVLDALPLTANGKLDRARLEALAASVFSAPPAVESQPTASVTPRQAMSAALHDGEAARLRRIITAAWAEALATPDPPPDVSFFDLGGTSLLLMRVQARVQAAGAPRLPIVAYFACPTINALAARMTGAPENQTPIVATGRVEARRAALGRMRVRAAASAGSNGSLGRGQGGRT